MTSQPKHDFKDLVKRLLNEAWEKTKPMRELEREAEKIGAELFGFRMDYNDKAQNITVNPIYCTCYCARMEMRLECPVHKNTLSKGGKP